MRLIARALVSKLIKDQFNIMTATSHDRIYAKFKVKPYKREGKTWLYNIKDLESAGITFTDNLQGYYPIPKFKDKYWIDKEANILNVNTMRKVKSYRGSDGYEHVILPYYGKKYRKRVHSLMGKVFLGNPPVVNHRDGIKHNNKLYNLERSTHKDNIKHAYNNDMYVVRGGTGKAVAVTDKETGSSLIYPSLRKAELATGVDRHRIKRIILGDNVNNTNWDFKYS